LKNALSWRVLWYSTWRPHPVIASGHISDDIAAQKEELLAMAQTGIDALVLVTNHLDPRNEGSEFFLLLNRCWIRCQPRYRWGFTSVRRLIAVA
jgi:hypothetical protein